MSLIVAARYDTFDAAGHAARRLFDRGFPVADMHTFYVNPPGEHAAYLLGGDHTSDARGASTGAWIAAAVLAMVGVFMAMQMMAPAWAVIAAGGAGAYLGALIGALSAAGRRSRTLTAPRRHGVLLALRVDPERASEGTRVLRQAGGADLERANGQWINSRWADFDPLQSPAERAA